MPVCRSCNTAVPAGNGFCGKCGARLEGPQEAPTNTALPRASPTPSDSVDEGRFPAGSLLAQRYRIVSLLGRGGMGEVYRATDLLLAQTVALKFLPTAATTSEAALTRFRNEVRTARLVSHPNVCRVFDIGEAEGLTYLTMEYVDGEDLRSLLHRIGKLPFDKALEIARKTCAGLAAAHDKGVIHRDLKPANIMLDGEGQVRITDFGLAGFAEQFRDVRSGTPAYMAPEQKAGKEVTARSDIYALGVVLHEVFTGKRPSEGSKPELDPVVDRVVQRCLDPDPQRRAATALAVSAALPGGDPLAVALEAGETPTPEMVAAAGEKYGMSVHAAAGWFAVACIGLIAVALLGWHTSVLRIIPFDNSTEVLAQKARDLIQSLGYAQKPYDTGSGWERNMAYREYSERQQTRAEYLAQMAEGRPSPLYFWFRQSPQRLVTLDSRHVLSQYDPPMDAPGMISVQLDTLGRLQRFAAVPPSDEEQFSGIKETHWSGLFRASGLDPARFTPAPPRRIPLVGFDTRAAWTGSWAHAPQMPVRIEAASWRGKPVHFEITGPWGTGRFQPPPRTRTAASVVNGLIYLMFATACLLAWRNVRLGRGDTRGAFRLAGFILACTFVQFLCLAHHRRGINEFRVISDGVGGPLWKALWCWVFYVALEPYVRRRWPQSLIGWTRLLNRGFHDLHVGPQLLVGGAFGVCMALLVYCWEIPFRQRGFYRINPFIATTLMDTRQIAGQALSAMDLAIGYTLIFFFLFFLLRVLMPRQWLASSAWILLWSGLAAAGGALPAINAIFVALMSGMIAFVATRFGLLPLVTAMFAAWMLMMFPMTVDFSVWYAGATLFALATVFILAAYSFRTALAGRPFFKEGFLEG